MRAPESARQLPEYRCLSMVWSIGEARRVRSIRSLARCPRSPRSWFERRRSCPCPSPILRKAVERGGPDQRSSSRAQVRRESPCPTNRFRSVAKRRASPGGQRERCSSRAAASRRRILCTVSLPRTVSTKSMARPSAGSRTRFTKPSRASRDACRLTTDRSMPTSAASRADDIEPVRARPLITG